MQKVAPTSVDMSVVSVEARNELARCVLAADAPKTRGRPRRLSTIQALDCILFVCRTGCQWSSLPCPPGVSHKTVYHRFSLWSRLRIFEHAFYSLSSAYRAAAPHRPLIADTTFVKNVYGHDVLGRTHTDRGRNSTKVSVLADSARIPLALAFHRGNRNDCMTLHHLLSEARRKTRSSLSSHRVIYADKGYDSELCRSCCTVPTGSPQ